MSKKKAATGAIPASQYTHLLGEIKQRIRHAQTRAWMAVNAELIRLYWCIGQVIDSRQQQEGYGTAVIPRLARDLHNELPEVKGFSERNINRMLAFYRLYPGADLETEVLPQAVAKPSEGGDPALPPKVVPQPVAQLLLSVPWGHHAVLMEKVKEAPACQWYMQAILENGWSRHLLLDHIKAATHLRVGQAASNFSLRLPVPDSDLAQQSLKDPYKLDFLTLGREAGERAIEGTLVRHVTVLYTSDDGQNRLHLRVEAEMIWLSKLEVVKLFHAATQNR